MWLPRSAHTYLWNGLRSRGALTTSAIIHGALPNDTCFLPKLMAGHTESPERGKIVDAFYLPLWQNSGRLASTHCPGSRPPSALAAAALARDFLYRLRLLMATRMEEHLVP
jgi:hypothetical protein